MAAKRKYINIMSPFGTFRWPKLTRPDDKYGKYQTELVLDKAGYREFVELLRKHAKDLCPDLENPKLPIKKDKKDGTPGIVFRSKNKPVIVDAKRQRLADGVWIRGGSEGRVHGVLVNHDDGVSLWMDAVQVTKLAEGGARGADAFEAVEGGYEFEGAPDADTAFNDGADKVEAEAAAGDDYDL